VCACWEVQQVIKVRAANKCVNSDRRKRGLIVHSLKLILAQLTHASAVRLRKALGIRLADRIRITFRRIILLSHAVPWQAVLGEAFIRGLIFITLIVLSLVSGFFDWPSFITALFLFGGFSIIILLLPLLLNLSRSYFWLVFSI